MVAEDGVTMPAGSVVAVPAALADEWASRGWAMASVESPGAGGHFKVAADGQLADPAGE